MNWILLLFALLLVCGLLFAAEPDPAAQDAPRAKASHAPDREVVYKKTPTRELKLQVYLPADWRPADKRPTIVFFFGGGFVGGTPEQFYSKAEYLASRRMVAFCAEYRVHGRDKTTIDECVMDARSAVRFIRSNASEWGVDPDRIVAAGGSAGANLSAAVCLFDGPDDPADDVKVSCRAQAMVLFNPVADLAAARQRLQQNTDRIPGRTLEEKLALLKRLSPCEYLRKDMPPMIVFYGDRDEFYPPGREFVKNALALGSRAELWVAPGAGHGFFNPRGYGDATMLRVDEFLAALGYLEGPPTVKPTDPKAVIKKELPE